jgi:2-polyprenyl-6-hydroxyphenyl methylase/3-demethylubiquinone-9 3-methyltransferase
MKSPATGTVDPSEIERFSALAAEWWNPAGKFRPLHKFNPARVEFIKRKACEHFGRDFANPRALDGLRILDIGCGGGLLSEPLARMGAHVVGADASPTNIGVATHHAHLSGLQIDYRATTAEALADAGQTYDLVLAMEIIEHVADVGMFLDAIARMTRPGGLLLVATINRTMKAWALAIVAAEQILRWLPRGTHSYDKLVRPEEIEIPLAQAGLNIIERVGVFYHPLEDRWKLSTDTDVNYMVLAGRPGQKA